MWLNIILNFYKKMKGTFINIVIKMDENYLKDHASAPTSNDYYFKDIVTKDQANEDNTWYPYIYETIKCNVCKKNSNYKAKSWFLIFRSGSGVLNGFTCEQCLRHKEFFV